MFALSVTILVLAGISVLSLTSNILKENNEIARISQLHEQLEEVRLGIRTAMIHQRDFLITGDTIHQVLYESSKRNTIAQFEAIPRREITGIFSLTTYDSLDNLMYSQFRRLDMLIDLGEEKDLEEIDNLLEYNGSGIFQKFTALNKTVELNIEQMFANFRTHTVASANRLKGFILSFYILSVVGLLMSFYYIFRQNRVILKLVDELKKTNELKNKFFSIIAHDLRSPFSLLINLSEILSDQDIRSDENTLKEIHKRIEETSKRTFNLLNNLLDWANSQAGQLKIRYEIFRIDELLEEIRDFYHNQICEKSIHLSLSHHEEKVLADRDMIHTVLRNLVGNAIKFVPEGGRIDLQVETTEDATELLVIDNGPGLTQADTEKLFRPEINTRTIGSDTENSGSGLGLILCKEFIDRHGGKIFARANQDKGCTFGFTLPHSPGP